MVRICQIAGLLSLTSLFWFAAGMPPWWAPIEQGDVMRVLLLYAFHAAGIFAGIFGILAKYADA